MGSMRYRYLRMLAFAAAAAAVVTTSAQHFSEWSSPVNLGRVVNSTFNDQHPAVAPDGLSLYFVSDRPGGQGGFDLWVTQRDSPEDPWQEPFPLPSTVNSAAAEFAPAFSPSGHLLFLGSDRPNGCGDRDLWVSFRKNKRDDLGWQTPVNLGCVINFEGFDDGPTYVEEDNGTVTLYFTSLNRPGGLGDFDIWASTMNADGTFGLPVNVSELNTLDRDTRTAIRRGGEELLLSSTRPGGVGALDIWMATRAEGALFWSVPVNLGSVVNSTANDGAPALSRDGRSLFFYSNRAGGIGANDIWVSARRKVTGNYPGIQD